MKILAIVNQKGGVGKTTTTAQLAWGLANRGYKVLAIDLDPQGNLSAGMGAVIKAGTPTVMEWLGLNRDGKETPADKIIQHCDGVDLIPANIYLDSGETELLQRYTRELCLIRHIRRVRGGYDYVLIDCRPSLGLLTVNALTAANEVIVPIKSDFYSLQVLEQLLDTVTEIRLHCNPKLQYNGFLITMLDSRRNTTEFLSVLTAVAGAAGGKVYTTRIRLSAAAADAPGAAQSVYEYKPKSIAAADYNAFTEEFLYEEEVGNYVDYKQGASDTLVIDVRAESTSGEKTTSESAGSQAEKLQD
jgi:chromosome partitioning protein